MKNPAISDRIIELRMLESVLDMINCKIDFISKNEMVKEPMEDSDIERNEDCKKRIAALKTIADKL